MKASSWYLSIPFLTLWGCLEPFDIPRTDPSNNLLVIDGYLGIEESNGEIRLSRTQGIGQTFSSVESGASVSIEDKEGNSYNLIEGQPGFYGLEGKELSAGETYRLRIITISSREYVSAYVTILPTPPIDTLYWKADFENNEVSILVSTSNPIDESSNYRWRYTETWEYESPYKSVYEIKDGMVIPRDSSNLIYLCWKSVNSTQILTESTSRLNENLVLDYELTKFPWLDDRIKIRYSILVEQVSIDGEELQYWHALKKNTENLGTLFDPLPSQSFGNITAVSYPDERVLGFFSFRDVKQKRIFIDVDEVEQLFGRRPYDPGPCGLTMITYQAFYAQNFSDAHIFNDWYIEGVLNPIGYLLSKPGCLDCRLKGGTTTKPEFWD